MQELKSILNIFTSLKRNTILKIFAVILAFLLWAYVQYVENPEVGYHDLEIPVTITGEAEINSNGFVINMPARTLKVNLTITAKRTAINSIDPSILSAYVDVSTAKTAGDQSFQIKVNSDNPEISIVSKRPAAVSLFVDKILTVNRPVRISYDGTLDQQCYIDIDNVTITPPLASIKIPEQITDDVSEVLVRVDMSDITSDVNGFYIGDVIDSKGEEIQNKFVSITNENFNIKIPILKRKTVPIYLKNIPPDKIFDIDSVNVEVAGTADVIDRLEFVEGFIKDYDPEKEDKSFSVTLKLDGLIQLDKNEITAYVIDKSE